MERNESVRGVVGALVCSAVYEADLSFVWGFIILWYD